MTDPDAGTAAQHDLNRSGVRERGREVNLDRDEGGSWRGAVQSQPLASGEEGGLGDSVVPTEGGDRLPATRLSPDQVVPELFARSCCCLRHELCSSLGSERRAQPIAARKMRFVERLPCTSPSSACAGEIALRDRFSLQPFLLAVR